MLFDSSEHVEVTAEAVGKTLALPKLAAETFPAVAPLVEGHLEAALAEE